MTENTEKRDESHGHGHKVSILVDGVKHEVRPGQWVVRELKDAVGVPQAKVLAEVSPQGLLDLDDSETIAVHEGQRFMSHVRTGGSS